MCRSQKLSIEIKTSLDREVTRKNWNANFSCRVSAQVDGTFFLQIPIYLQNFWKELRLYSQRESLTLMRLSFHGMIQLVKEQVHLVQKRFQGGPTGTNECNFLSFWELLEFHLFSNLILEMGPKERLIESIFHVKF